MLDLCMTWYDLGSSEVIVKPVRFIVLALELQPELGLNWIHSNCAFFKEQFEFELVWRIRIVNSDF